MTATTDKVLRQLIAKKSEELIATVESTLVERYRGGVLLSEADFIAGVGTVLQLLAMEPSATEIPAHLMPSLWIFTPMGGRSIVAALLKRQGEEEKYVNRVESEAMKKSYRIAAIGSMVSFLHSVFVNGDLGHIRKSRMTPSETLTWLRQEARVILDEIFEEVEGVGSWME